MANVFTKNRIKSLNDEIIVDVHGFRIKISNVADRIEVLFKNVLYSALQEIVLQKLCNGNIRLALRAFENYLKYRDLSFNLMFEMKDKTAFPYKDEQMHIPRFNQFLSGVMIGDRQLYSEIARNSVVSNIFEYRSPERAEADHIILYALLCVFYSHGGYIKISRILTWMAQCGYLPQVTSKAVRHLLSRGLLLSPESDGNDDDAEHAKITTTGSYYVDSLTSNDAYLLNVAFDTELRISNPNSISETRFFTTKLAALTNLTELVTTQEHAFLFRLYNDSSPVAARVLKSIQLCGPVSIKIFDAIRKMEKRILARERSPRFMQQTDAAFGDSKEKLWPLIKRMQSLSRRQRQKIMKVSTAIETKDARVDGLGRIQMAHPSCLLPGRNNCVEVSFAPTFSIGANELIASWRGMSQNVYFREFFSMKRQGQEVPFKGKFSVQPDKSTIQFPMSSELSFFDAARELGAAQLAE